MAVMPRTAASMIANDTAGAVRAMNAEARVAMPATMNSGPDMRWVRRQTSSLAIVHGVRMPKV